MAKKEVNWTGLKEKLEKMDFPQVYFFKFIFPNDNRTLALVEALFGPEAQVRINKSRNGNYLSVSAKEMMIEPEKVIDRYKEAAKIEGVMSL
jgi:putative lipoic acid-binding regulatory protein